LWRVSCPAIPRCLHATHAEQTSKLRRCHSSSDELHVTWTYRPLPTPTLAQRSWPHIVATNPARHKNLWAAFTIHPSSCRIVSDNSRAHHACDDGGAATKRSATDVLPCTPNHHRTAPSSSPCRHGGAPGGLEKGGINFETSCKRFNPLGPLGCVPTSEGLY
jgi:hypothetical protein